MPFASISRLLLLAAGIIVLLLSGCGQPRPTLFIPASPPRFTDDCGAESLQRAIASQRRYLARFKAEQEFVIAGTPYTADWLDRSLAAFLDILARSPTPSEFNRLLSRDFIVYQAGGRAAADRGEMLVTGYYEPLFEGSLTPDPPFVHPLYRTPDDLVEGIDDHGNTRLGRIDDGGAFRPYWTRREIDLSNVLAGHELVYLRDRFDAFLLHVQGSGRIRLRDGTIRSLHYSANNGHAYTSIGKKLVDDNIFSLEEVDTDRIRQYIADNPDKAVDLLSANRRYIFFAWGEGNSPRGSLGLELTPGRSIAVDQTVLPVPALGYLVTRRPIFADDGALKRWIPLHCFVVAQDSGAAIRGPGRVDLFWGNGGYAAAAAGAMKEKGRLYFLVKKQRDPHD